MNVYEVGKFEWSAAKNVGANTVEASTANEELPLADECGEKRKTPSRVARECVRARRGPDGTPTCGKRDRQKENNV